MMRVLKPLQDKATTGAGKKLVLGFSSAEKGRYQPER